MPGLKHGLLNFLLLAVTIRFLLQWSPQACLSREALQVLLGGQHHQVAECERLCAAAEGAPLTSNLSLKSSVGPFKLARSASRSCRARALPFLAIQKIPRTPRVFRCFVVWVLEGGVDGVGALRGRCGEGDQGSLCQGRELRRIGSVTFRYNKTNQDDKPSPEEETEYGSRQGSRGCAKIVVWQVLGSAVNPVLREGNSDRRAAVPVKEYVPWRNSELSSSWLQLLHSSSSLGLNASYLQSPAHCAQAFKYPHSMGAWSNDSKTHAASPEKGSRLSKIEDSGFRAQAMHSTQGDRKLPTQECFPGAA